MKVLLFCKKKMLKFNLPNEVSNSYWFTDNERKKIFKIIADNNKWRIESNNYAKIIKPKYIKISNTEIEVINFGNNDIYAITGIIQEEKMYAIELGDVQNIGILYVTDDDSREDFEQFNIINTKEFTIGSSTKNQIIYKNSFVSNVHAKIYKVNDSWYIKNYDMLFGTFVNNIPINFNDKKIFNGDVIYIMGLKFIMINDNIYINNPNSLVKINKEYFLVEKHKNITILEESDRFSKYDDIEINTNKNYFSRGPRLIEWIDTKKIKIDAPPSLNEKEEKPMMLTMGATIGMGIVMVLSLVTSINGISNGKISAIEIVIPLITALIMLIAMIVLPIINLKYDKKLSEKDLEKREYKYRQYLRKKSNEIEKIKLSQKEWWFKNYLSSKECIQIIENHDYRLWERKIEDPDFISVRLGIGDVPLKIQIESPEDSFSVEDNELLDELNNVVEAGKVIKEAPLVVSLIEKNISAIICHDDRFLNNYIKNIILQLITFQSYSDLKLVFLVNDDILRKWDYAKLLPYVWDDKKQIRFFAEDYNEQCEISNFLVEELEKRKELNLDNKQYNSYYLIITDNYNGIEQLKIVQEICKSKKNYGFGILCITDEVYKLPNECKIFINIDKGLMHESKLNKELIHSFKVEKPEIIFYENIVQTLSNINIIPKTRDAYLLPHNYTFLEMYNLDNIYQLNILKRWKQNDTTLSLKAPIGIDENGKIIFLDAHEKFHGPHGLIAGSTGSGKSETLITYILSLAINYHPYDVSFLIIDYKGGGLAGAFKKGELELPHLVGTITNIDTVGLQRSLISIQSELRKRQILFNEVRSMTNEGTIDIYKYQKLYHDGKITNPISHLFIICDEFAELKQQQSEFMDELISVSRIGRSLGVHLILATQKPAGIINEQIRSNSKFAICLKVQNPSDSIDVINKPDAALLKNPGQFYMQVRTW